MKLFLLNDGVTIVVNKNEEVYRMRIARIFRAQSNEDKLACITRYCMDSVKQGIIFCFSKEECERIVANLKSIGVEAALYYRSSKGSNSKNQKNDSDILDTEFLNGEIKTLVVPMFYKVDLGRCISCIDYILYYNRPTFMKDYIGYYDEIYINRRPGDCFMFLVNGQIKEEYDEYFLSKAAKTEMVEIIYNVCKSSKESMSEKDIAKKLGCDIGRVRYSFRYLIDKGILINEYPGSTKFKLVQGTVHFDSEDIEAGYRQLQYEYQKMLNYCWKEQYVG